MCPTNRVQVSLSECNVLFYRCEELKSQYKSDIQRLSFIVDGLANKEKDNRSKCPFCDSDVAIHDTPNYIEASKAEFKKIRLQLKDLERTLLIIENEKSSLEERTNVLEKEKENIENLINTELKPQISDLQQKLSQYRSIIGIQSEIDVIKKLTSDKEADISLIDSEDEATLKFKPKEHLERNILDIIDQYLKEMLEKCNFTRFSTARFDRTDLDLIVNGNKKKTYGKGYRAFLNTILSTVWARYLNDNGKYPPGLLIFDSPIRSLKEPDDKIPDSMQDSLFRYFVEEPLGLQIILIENDIPLIEYGDTNVIKFTKIQGEGRYGLLNGVFD